MKTDRAKHQLESPGGIARGLLLRAREAQLVGSLQEAAEGSAEAVDAGRAEADLPAVAEALRRLAITHHLRAEPESARHYALEAHALAASLGHARLTAEALNALANMATEAGDLRGARIHYLDALEAAGGEPDLAARIEQNLGMLASIEGCLDRAVAHYQRALAGYQQTYDEHGCAMVYHNLGMLCSDRREWQHAHEYFTRCRQLATVAGDQHLQALCLTNYAEVLLGERRYEEGRRELEAALEVFDRLDTPADKATAYRLLGVVFRETGRTALAESRLRSAVDIAARAKAPLEEAEAWLDLAHLYARGEERGKAAEYAARAREVFARVGARGDQARAEEMERQLAYV